MFDDGSQAQCIALVPPEKKIDAKYLNWSFIGSTHWWEPDNIKDATNSNWRRIEEWQEYHLAPEIFVSDGTPDSIVGKWVANRDGIGGIHHIAYQVENVREVARAWVEQGWGEFSGDVLTCPEDELEQIFSKPHPLTGVIYEFIKRGAHGFCEANVQRLMESTKDNK